jgi:hypothetical protein
MSWADDITAFVDFDNDGTWEDVSAYLSDAEVTRGATRTESPVMRYEPGNASFTFRNEGREFDPTNLQGPYVEYGPGGASDNPEHVFVCTQRQFFGQGWTVNVASAVGQTALVRSVSAKATGATSSTTVPKPTGTVSGDKLIAFHFCDVGPLTDMGTPTGGASWGTVKASKSEGDEALQGKVWEKTAGGSEPSSYGFTQNGSADGVIIIVAIQTGTWTGGATYATPVSNPETKYFTTPANTPIGTNDLVIRAVNGTGSGSNTSSWSEPTPQEYTEGADLQSFEYTTGAIYYRNLVASSDPVGIATLIKPQRPVKLEMPVTFTATTNYVKNPSAEIDTTDIGTFTNGSVDRVDDVSRWGGFSVEVRRVATNPSFYIYGASFQTDSGITNGNQVTISAYIYIPEEAWDPGLGFMLNANTLTGSFVTGPTAPDTWHRLTLTGTVTGAVTEVQVQIWTDDVHHDGQVIAYIDGVQIEKKATASDYCDGAQPACTWSGTEHDSSSSRPASHTFGLFLGYVDQWLVQWQDPNWSIATAPATDGMKLLSRNERVAVAAVGAGEDTGARVDRILDSAGWPAGLRDIAVGDSTVQATTLEGSALDELQKVADTEIGELFINGSGVLVFRNRQALISDTRSAMPQLLLSDDDSDPQAVPYSGLGLSYDHDQFANSVIATREGGSPQTATDADAIEEANGTITYDATGMLMESDEEAQAYADWILYISKDPELRFSEVTIQVHSDPDRLIPLVLAREIGDRIKIVRNPPGGGDPIVREVFIRGIKHVLSKDLTWETTWSLQSATKVGSFLTFDHPTLSILGLNALGY